MGPGADGATQQRASDMNGKTDKSSIFIASSGRTLVLAEKLRDELRTEFCEATLWSEEGRLQPGAVIIEMLEGAAAKYDFAVVILAKDDVMIGGKGETLKARDNCVFEAGRLYLKHGNDFIHWASGPSAYGFWCAVRKKPSADDPKNPDAVFHGARDFNLAEGSFLRALRMGMRKYFPGFGDEVMQLCLEGPAVPARAGAA